MRQSSARTTGRNGRRSKNHFVDTKARRTGRDTCLFLWIALCLLAQLLAGTPSATAMSTAPAIGPRPAPAQAATPAVGLMFPGGPGHPDPVYAGTWNNGVRSFCIDFGLHSPMNSGTAELKGSLPGMDAEQSARVKFLVNTYVMTKAPRQAARAQMAVWAVEGDADFKAWFASASVSKADRKAVGTMVTAAKTHGPYEMSLQLDPVLVGQQGRGSVKVVASNGRVPVGVPVVLSATGGKILTTGGITGRKGTTGRKRVSFTYERTHAGPVRVSVALTAPSSRIAGISITPPPHQETLGGGYVETAVANHSYTLAAERPTIVTSDCDTECKGVATVAFRICNPAGSDPIRWIEKTGGRVVATLEAAGGECSAETAKLADGKKIASSYCYTRGKGGKCTTAVTKVPGAFEVICPPWATASYQLACACDSADGGTITFTSPKNSVRHYRGFVTVTDSAGTSTRAIDLVNGRPVEFAVGPLPRGGDLVISFRVYSDSGRSTLLHGPHVLGKITIGDPTAA